MTVEGGRQSGWSWLGWGKLWGEAGWQWQPLGKAPSPPWRYRSPAVWLHKGITVSRMEVLIFARMFWEASSPQAPAAMTGLRHVSPTSETVVWDRGHQGKVGAGAWGLAQGAPLRAFRWVLGILFILEWVWGTSPEGFRGPAETTLT